MEPTQTHEESLISTDLFDSPGMGAFLNTLKSATRIIGDTDRLLREAGTELTTREWDTLVFADVYGPLRPTELLRRAVLTHSPQTLSSAIDRLVDRELLNRSHHPDDGRAVLVEATPKGHDLVIQLFPAIERQIIQPFLAGLSTEEVATLDDALRRL